MQSWGSFATSGLRFSSAIVTKPHPTHALPVRWMTDLQAWATMKLANLERNQSDVQVWQKMTKRREFDKHKKKTISGLCLTLTHPVSRMKWIFIILQYLPSRPFHSILIQLWSSFCTFYLSNNSWIFLCTCAGPFSSPLALWLAPYSCITESPTLKTWQSSSVKKIQSFLSLIIKLNSPIFKSEKKTIKQAFQQMSLLPF